MPVLRLAHTETLEWFERALGLQTVLSVPDEHGGLAHAEMRYGDDWLMAASGNGAIKDQPPGAASLYLTVATDEEVDAAYERAIAAGATSFLKPVDQDYGGRGATVRDPEGNYWSFGSYLPEDPPAS